MNSCKLKIDCTIDFYTEQSIEHFMKFFHKSFPAAEATIPIKMHVLEDHAIPWVNSTHVGFGLLGEQGAESIHAKFTRLGLAHTAVTDIVLHLLCIVKEHLISMAPQVVTAIPTTKEKKLTYTSQGNMKIFSAFGYMYMSATSNSNPQASCALCTL